MSKVAKKAEAKKDEWVIKDRVYVLKQGSPVTRGIKSRGIYWFDEEKGYERELKYTTNQRSVFVDEFNGTARLAHIAFRDGELKVPKEKQTLQKLLSLYHPDKDKIYFEFDAEARASDEIDQIELEFEALQAASTMDVSQAEAIVRINVGAEVAKMTSREIKRDLMVFAKRDPELFLELANDENVQVRNTAVKAVEQGLIKLSEDQRTFKWTANGKKLMTVPFDENPYSAMAAWFKTDEGVDVFKAIEKKLK